MGLLDNLKARLEPAKGKVSDLAQQHGDKIDRGLDKMARTVDERTKGKYSDRIQTGTGKARAPWTVSLTRMPRAARREAAPPAERPAAPPLRRDRLRLPDGVGTSALQRLGT